LGASCAAATFACRDKAGPLARSGRSASARRRLAAENGMTLVELLVVTALLTLVLGATLTPFEIAQRETPKDVEYAKAISDASTGLQQMIREIRQAYRINSASANAIDFNAVINSSDLEIAYQCDEPFPNNGNPHYAEYRRCLRVSATTGSALPAISGGAVAIDRLLNGTATNPVFTFKDSNGEVDLTHPTYVQAAISVPSRGALYSGLTHKIELSNGTAIPNLLIK
jgi:prepilin-type N-terminal cleavage/methylation domain-containing protein